MGKHIEPFDNKNKAIIGEDNGIVPLCYFNNVHLTKGETFEYSLQNYETAIVMACGTCHIKVDDHEFDNIGKRTSVFDGDPASVYAPVGSLVRIECLSDKADILIGGGRFDKKLEPFCVRESDVDHIQYGSDETKTHRKIKHILGTKNLKGRGRLLVSELFTVGAGGWSGFPPHKHDVENPPSETRFQEVYQFRFNPGHGFGAQFLYEKPEDFGPVYHVRTGSVIAIDKGYHPSVAAPGYEMYYFTIICGEVNQSLKMFFDPNHEYQVHTIPGIKDMVGKFK